MSRWIVSLLWLALASNCTNYLVQGNNLAFRDYAGVKKLAETPVKGEACRQWILLIPFGEVSIPAAFKDAVSKSPPGTTGLAKVNVQFYSSRPAVGILAGRECFYVEGIPASVPSPALTSNP